MERREQQLFWQRHIDEQARGSVSAVEYCRQRGLRVKSFYDWKYRLRKTPLRATSVVRSGFVRVVPKESSEESFGVCVYLPAGVKLSCGSYPDPRWVVGLVKAMSEGVER